MGFFTGRLTQKISNQIISKNYISDFLSGADLKSGFGSIDEYAALKYSAFFGCLRVLAETFCSAPVAEYQKIDDKTREKTNDTGIYDLLKYKPNENMDGFNYHEQLMYQINIGGNAVSLKRTNRFNEIVELIPYQWHETKIELDSSTKKVKYEIAGKEFSRDKVFHIPGPSLNGITGLSPLEFAANAIKLGLTYETFGIKFYQNGALPSGVFEHPSVVDDSIYQRLKESLKREYTKLANIGTPMLLEDGIKFNQMTIKPIDAELLSSKKFQIEDMCRFLRVPLHLVQNLDKATNNNIEHQSLEFVMYTMLPIFKRVESAINTQLLTKQQRDKGYYFEYNLSGLLRGDQKSMAESFAMGRQWGWLSVNDIRKLLNLNPIDNGNIYLQPMNMIEAGKEADEYKKEVENMLKLIEQRG